MAKWKKKSLGDVAFDVINVTILLMLTFLFLYPVYFVLCASVSQSDLLIQNPGILFYPKGFNLGAYKLTISHPFILSGYKNILLILIAYIPINILLTWLCGYFLASKNVMFKNVVLVFLVIPMFFSGGLIPSFLNIRDLGLYDSLWALILPGAVSIFNCIICRTAIDGIPSELFESAYIDGANDFTLLFKIVVPLIVPTTAVLVLFGFVGQWNSWFAPAIYLKSDSKLPIQNVIRAILVQNQLTDSSAAASGDRYDRYADVIKYSAIVVSTAPVLCIYPFLQKYFTKGVMVGAVKG